MLFTRFNACHSFVSSYHRITRTSSHGFKGNNKLIRYLSTAYMRSDSDGLKELNLEGILKKSNILKKTCVYKSNSGEMIHAVEEELSVKLSVPLLTINEIVENEKINSCIIVQGNNSVDIFDYSIGLVSIQQTGQKLRYKYMRKAPPFIVNLSSDSMLGKRLEQAKKGKQEMILKAAIPKGVDNLVVYDLTAGFGRDSAIMASSSAVKKVVMVERDPIVSILLWDALRRLIKSDNMSHLEHTLAEKLEMVCDDSCSVLADIYEWRKVKPDICFLDVMFPPRTKSSAVKKNMVRFMDLGCSILIVALICFFSMYVYLANVA